MKTNFRFYLLMMVIPLLVFACGGRGKKANQGGADTTRTDTSATTQGANMTSGNQQGGDFVADAASSNMYEIELGKYAEQNAKSSRVKNFATMVVKDHSQANDELKDLAQKQNMQFPPAMKDKAHNQMTDVEKKQGADFDKDYIDAMVKDHNDDIDKFKNAAENNPNPEIKSWAAKTLPVLIMHLDSAKAIQNSLK